MGVLTACGQSNLQHPHSLKSCASYQLLKRIAIWQPTCDYTGCKATEHGRQRARKANVNSSSIGA